MKSINLFSGIGGFELGFKKSGIEALYSSEILPAAAKVISTHFPETEIKGDIKLIKSLPKADVITAGFPCQDISSSGKKTGFDGVRSSLISDVFRLIKKDKPQWIVIENVKFMLHLKKGEFMDCITETLSKMGYNWAYRTFNSQWFGVPQRRERVFIIASLDYKPSDFLFERISADPPPEISSTYGFYWTEGRYSTGLCHGGIPPLKGGSTIGIPSPPGLALSSGKVGTPTIRDAERLQGFPADWTLPSADIEKSSVRWKLVGNAITVEVAEWIASNIKNVTHGLSNPKEYVPLHSSFPKKWPLCAYQNKRAPIMAVCPPPEAETRNIDAFLTEPLKPLSLKGISGFLRRAREGNLNYPDGFLERLDSYRETFTTTK